jgi:amino acid transporter
VQPVRGSDTTREGLIRRIRRWDLLLLVLNTVIGAGIFGLPAEVFARSGAWSLIAYAACAVLVALLNLCFAEVASRFNVTGGPYLYASAAFGPAVGFLTGWLVFLTRLIGFAALANLWLDYCAFFWPGVNEGAPRVLMITAIVVVFALLNVRGVGVSTLLNNGLTIAKLVPLVLFVAVGVFFIEPARFSFAEAPDLPSFSSAVLLLVFAFSGFEIILIPAGESTDPGRHTPFALFAGLGVVAALYVLIQFVSIGTLPDLGASTRPLADAAEAFMGTAGAALLSVGALISITGTLNAIMLVSPRLPFAMAEAGQAPRILAATHPQFHTPHVAILVSAVLMLVLTLQGSFISAVTIGVVVRLATYAVTCAALPVLRCGARPHSDRGVLRAPMGVTIATLATAGCLGLILTAEWRDIYMTAAASALGLALFFGFRKLKTR